MGPLLYAPAVPADLDHVRAELRELADLLETLPAADWDRNTACGGFRVRDVAAHLVLAREPVNRRTLSALARGPKGFSRLAGELSVAAGTARSPSELLSGLRRAAEHPRAGFLGRLDPLDNMLADHATHLQDVRVGLGLRAEHDPVRSRAVLDCAVRLWRPITWGTRERARGLRLVCTDADWAHGAGPEVSGPYDGLLLALGGRSAGVALLTGQGLPALAG